MNTCETSLPLLVVSYFLLHPDASLELQDMVRLFGEHSARRASYRLRDAEINGLVAVERPEKKGKKVRPSNVYRAGEALRRIRAKVST